MRACVRAGVLSEELRGALGMGDAAPPPWLINMQRYGPPPSYPALRIPGLNAPIPPGAQFGYQPGGWVDGWPVGSRGMGSPSFEKVLVPPRPPYARTRVRTKTTANTQTHPLTPALLGLLGSAWEGGLCMGRCVCLWCARAGGRGRLPARVLEGGSLGCGVGHPTLATHETG